MRIIEKFNCPQCKSIKLVQHRSDYIRQFCSQTCWANSRKKRKIIKCSLCKKEFEKKINYIKNNNFCSRKCFFKKLSLRMKGSNNPSWKGGQIIKQGNYILQYNKNSLRKRDFSRTQSHPVRNHRLRTRLTKKRNLHHQRCQRRKLY